MFVNSCDASLSRPFRLTLTDGRTYDVLHPELALVGRSWVAIGLARPGDSESIAERLVSVSLLAHHANRTLGIGGPAPWPLIPAAHSRCPTAQSHSRPGKFRERLNLEGRSSARIMIDGARSGSGDSENSLVGEHEGNGQFLVDQTHCSRWTRHQVSRIRWETDG